MVTKLFCDWCDKEIRSDGPDGYIYTVSIDMKFIDNPSDKTDWRAEVCESCYRKLVMPLSDMYDKWARDSALDRLRDNLGTGDDN